METRSDDSPGSDYSLDKSLQKKCVVDDLGGQGEGGTTTCSSDAGGGGTIKPTAPTQTELSGGSLANPAAQQSETVAAGHTHKTDQHVGDGGGGGAGGGGGLGCAGDVQRDYSDNNIGNCLSYDARPPNDSSHEHDTAAANSSSSQQNDSIAATMSDSGLSLPQSNPAAATTNNNNNNNATFETKVKQIAQNLKETSIAEQPAATTHTPDAPIDSSTGGADVSATSASLSASTSSSSSSSSTSSLEYEANASNSSLNTQADTSCSQPLELNVSMQSVASESQDDQRSKKVRFHPDVKENDGGNRVIPKKKKKLKNTPGGAGEEVLASTSAAAAAAAAAASTSNAQRSSISDDDMDMDDEDESTADEEEDFDLAKTIAEAEDYLKTHPLTFARAADKTSERMRNGLLDEEDLPQLSDSAEEEVEEMYDEITAENGVERILGKQTKAGKVEFLLRFVDRPGLHWEQEELIHKMCPNLLGKYELCRERRQERLMGHVAKRQNIRQRYTDF